MITIALISTMSFISAFDCTEDDYTWMDEVGFETVYQMVANCGFPCWMGGEDFNTCIPECLDGAGSLLTDDCEGCFIDGMNCVVENCGDLSECVTDPWGDVCMGCQMTNCGSVIGDCTGYVPPVEYACTDDDYSWIDEVGYENVYAMVANCGFPCWMGGEDFDTCIPECLDGAGSELSGDCVGCYVDAMDCVVENCGDMPECVTDPWGDICMGCQMTNCGTVLGDCTGYVPPFEYACTDDDYTWIDEVGYETVYAMVANCGFPCWMGGEDFDTCIPECLDGAGSELSGDCVGCYIDAMDCVVENCGDMSECVTDPWGEACMGCQMTNCGTVLSDCTGYVPPEEFSCSDDDYAWIDEVGFETVYAMVANCGFPCWMGGEDFSTCIPECLDGAGSQLSGDCVGCYIDAMDCVVVNCGDLPECVSDPWGDICMGCQMTNCGSVLGDCTGYVPPPCVNDGDANIDGSVDVLDVVLVVAYILGNAPDYTELNICHSDANSDTNVDILDVVMIVSFILEGRMVNANAAELILNDRGLELVSDGFVGAVQISLKHGPDFDLKPTSNAMVADYATRGNHTTLIVVGPENGVLFETDSAYEIEYAFAATDQGYIDVNIAGEYTLLSSYPNPFNPSTTISYVVPVDGNVTISVFDITGRRVEQLTNDYKLSGTHSVVWNAVNHPSGLYMVKMIAGNSSRTQKIMLLK